MCASVRMCEQVGVSACVSVHVHMSMRGAEYTYCMEKKHTKYVKRDFTNSITYLNIRDYSIIKKTHEHEILHKGNPHTSNAVS